MTVFHRIVLAGIVVVATSGALSTPAAAVIIVPTFDSSITSQPNAAAIEQDVDYAIFTVSRLYTNNITVPITFSFLPLGDAGAAQSSTYLDQVSYGNYINALRENLAANPGNGVLATALANLSKGNDATGSAYLTLTQTDAQMLGVGNSIGNNNITLNSSDPFTFAGQVLPCSGQCRAGPGTSPPISPTTFDANTALFHEIDEILGGGGQGSTINACFGNNRCHRKWGLFRCSSR